MYTLEDHEYTFDGDLPIVTKSLVEFRYMPGSPGRTSGPAEQCVAPEGDSIDIVWVICTELQIQGSNNNPMFPKPLECSGRLARLAIETGTLSDGTARQLGKEILLHDREGLEAACLEHARGLELSGAMER